MTQHFVARVPGRAITNCHVLRNAASIVLRIDKAEHVAQLEFPDPERDLCQLRAEGLPAPATAIGSTAALKVGQTVYAIGAPRGLEQTLSDGLISALRRNAAGDVEFIQVTAPISPGSSGGGLFDEHGQLIGITTATITGTAQNLNFARPAQWIAELPARGAAALAKYEQLRSAPPAAAAPRPVEAAAPVASADRPTQGVAGNAGPRATGQDTYNAEKTARTSACSAAPHASLMAKGAGFETYSIPCTNGDVLAVRCEFGNCRVLQ